MTNDEKVHKFNVAVRRLRMLEEELGLYFNATGGVITPHAISIHIKDGDEYIGSVSEFGGPEISEHLNV